MLHSSKGLEYCEQGVHRKSYGCCVSMDEANESIRNGLLLEGEREGFCCSVGGRVTGLAGSTSSWGSLNRKTQSAKGLQYENGKYDKWLGWEGKGTTTSLLQMQSRV